MFKKCKANCQANDNLYLRGNVFYYMVELPRQDGKRRYFGFIKNFYNPNLDIAFFISVPISHELCSVNSFL